MNTIAFLGNYAPRCCGIATFTQDLRSAVLKARPSIKAPVAMMSDRLHEYEYPEEVKVVLDEKDRSSYAKAAELLNRSGISVVSLQHEYGIFGGPSGIWLLDLLRRLRVPVVTTCHTVLRSPSPEQHQVMCEIARHSSRLVVMAEKGRELLREHYDIPDDRIEVIPHGIPDCEFTPADRESFRETLGWSQRRVLFTFGLLGPSKGIEYAVRALPEIVRRHPDVLYVVAGRTHPNLLREQGEQYRESLTALAEELGVAEHLEFINRFVGRDELVQMISAADIYTTPYLNEAQITSGTLAYAFGMGKPVVSTPYWHASELLADDRGVIVPFGDTAAIANAVTNLMSDDEARSAMSEMAYHKGRSMTWAAVGEEYARVLSGAAHTLRAAPVAAGYSAQRATLPPLRHLERLHGKHGLYQHAFHTEPDPAHGYCTDDNARAAICLTDIIRSGQANADIMRLFDDSFHFLLNACDFRTDRFRNFMDKDGRWLENTGSEDSHGRALWALGHIINHHTGPSIRQPAQQVFRAAAPAVARFTSPRAWAFTILGLTKYIETFPADRTAVILRDELASRLERMHSEVGSGEWQWFENYVTYDNGKLPQALIAAARQTGNGAWRQAGLRTLDFLVKAQTAPAGHFRPVGSDAFWTRSGEASLWDQQPLEAQAMTAACLEAAALTGQRRWLREAERAYAWFSGANELGLPLTDPDTGGCCDGLQENGLNLNQGAESTLAWLQAAAGMKLAAGLFSTVPVVIAPPETGGRETTAAA